MAEEVAEMLEEVVVEEYLLVLEVEESLLLQQRVEEAASVSSIHHFQFHLSTLLMRSICQEGSLSCMKGTQDLPLKLV